MEPIRKHRGVVAPLYRENVDTDQIIPKQHLKRIERTGFGQFLFFDWRYHTDGRDREDFVLNQEHFRTATVLVTGKNFGCGSSREHAAWALGEFGFRVILAPSFADIFRNNAGNNGLLLIELPETVIRRIAEHADNHRPYYLSVDLENQTINDEFGLSETFAIDAFRRHRLLNGLDEIGMTLAHEADISRFENERKSRPPQG
jgi:3-isopropylmalate/(R)-2-methylmalate dehydratase small subunit